MMPQAKGVGDTFEALIRQENLQGKILESYLIFSKTVVFENHSV